MLNSAIGKAFHLHHETHGDLGDKDDLLSFHGKVLLRKNDKFAHVGDKLSELVEDKVTFQLVSAHSLSGTASHGTGIESKKVQLQNWHSKSDTVAADQGSSYAITFPVEKSFGKPGALLVTNNHHYEFYLDSVTLSVPEDHSQQIHFPCNSWIYNADDYGGPRVFFTNQVCLPSQTPSGVKALRDAELKQLQGDGTGERKQVDRIYDYDVYNDLGAPDKGEEYARPILGGSQEFPYPRRCRTGRERTNADPEAEKPASLLDLIYVPRDEIFDHTKASDFLGSSIKAIAHLLLPAVADHFSGRRSRRRQQFNSLEEINDLYVKGLDLSSSFSTLSREEEQRDDVKSHFELISELTTSDNKDTEDTSLLKFPLPQVIQKSKNAWSTDEEFSRQTLGGMHPIIIERVKVFPPVSKLDPQVYGPPTSSIAAHHIEPYLDGMSAQEAVEQKKLYILDYHDAFLPYIERINALEDHKAYASRTIFFLTKKGTLMPVAIELSLPSTSGRVDRVFVPPVDGKDEQKWLWRLAKTHAILNDTPVHQLVSHLLRTHSSLEPFIIASHRQLSALHPLLVLLLPHFKNTMNINAIARKVLLNAASGSNLIMGGIIELTFTAGKYAMELSSVLYKDWRFDEQGLPSDLMKRGMAERDPEAKHGLRLVIEDYPYAVDGLEVWAAIESWVREYVNIYYKKDEDVNHDSELQTWWQEVKEKGHGDKKDEPWWPAMNSIDNLTSTLTTIIWLASAHHAAINFGQYPYAGYMPYRPTMGHRLIPLPQTPEYAAFLNNPEAFLLASVSSPFQTTIGLAIIEVLSTHASNEEYLGQRLMPRWTNNMEVMNAFKRFQEKLVEVGQGIIERNGNPSLTNRYGEVQVPYTLLFPSSKEGITNRGIPNSTSI